MGEENRGGGKGLKAVHVHDTVTSGVGRYIISGRGALPVGKNALNLHDITVMTSLPVGKNAVNLHDITVMTSLPVCDVTSGREKRRKPTRYYSYDVTSGL